MLNIIRTNSWGVIKIIQPQKKLKMINNISFCFFFLHPVNILHEILHKDKLLNWLSPPWREYKNKNMSCCILAQKSRLKGSQQRNNQNAGVLKHPLLQIINSFNKKGKKQRKIFNVINKTVAFEWQSLKIGSDCQDRWRKNYNNFRNCTDKLLKNNKKCCFPFFFCNCGKNTRKVWLFDFKCWQILFYTQSAFYSHAFPFFSHSLTSSS